MAPSKINVNKWFTIGAVIVPLLSGVIICPVSDNTANGNILLPVLADKLHLNFSVGQILVCLLIIITGTTLSIVISKKIIGKLKAQKGNLILDIKNNEGKQCKA
jgi:hypothetical protein